MAVAHVSRPAPLIRLDGGAPVARLTLACPERRNPLTPELCDELLDALARVEAEPGIRCLIVTGEQGVFAAGADLRGIAANSPAENLAFNRRLVEALDALEGLTAPTIAAIDGPALGGGLELALRCTLRVASTRAQLGLPEVRLGILPGAGGTERLPRLIGAGPALKMLLTGRPVTAEQAAAFGLVQEVAEPAELPALAERLAGEIAEAAPLSVAAIKRAVARGLDAPLDEARTLVERELAALLESSDSREGVASFLERRPPKFEGR